MIDYDILIFYRKLHKCRWFVQMHWWGWAERICDVMVALAGEISTHPCYTVLVAGRVTQCVTLWNLVAECNNQQNWGWIFFQWSCTVIWRSGGSGETQNWWSPVDFLARWKVVQAVVYCPQVQNLELLFNPHLACVHTYICLPIHSEFWLRSKLLYFRLLYPSLI